MRVCILCEDSIVAEVREKMKRDSILTIGCSQTGEEPATHRFCCIATDEKGANKLLESSQLTTMEISGPKEFLNKWNLKIIK
jgi:hypothetical protein